MLFHTDRATFSTNCQGLHLTEPLGAVKSLEGAAGGR